MKAPCSGWVSSPDGIKFEVVPCGAGAEIQNSASWKFCPQTHRIYHKIYAPSFIDIGPAVPEL